MESMTLSAVNAALEAIVGERVSLCLSTPVGIVATRAYGDVVLDSLDWWCLIVDVEAELGCRLEVEEELFECNTWSDLVGRLDNLIRTSQSNNGLNLDAVMTRDPSSS